MLAPLVKTVSPKKRRSHNLAEEDLVKKKDPKPKKKWAALAKTRVLGDTRNKPVSI